MNQEQMKKPLYNALGVQHITHAFLIWCVQGHASVIAQLSHPDLYELQLLH